VLVLVVYFDYFFFVGDCAYDVHFGNAIFLKQAHGFVCVFFVNDDAEAPAHVEGFEHFLVCNDEAEFCGKLIVPIQSLWHQKTLLFFKHLVRLPGFEPE